MAETTEMYCLRVLEASNLRSKRQYVWFLLAAMRGSLFHACLQLLVVVRQPLAFLSLEKRPLGVCLHIHTALSSCLDPGFSISWGHSHIGWGSAVMPSSYVYSLPRPYFKIRSHSLGLGVRTAVYSWRTHFKPKHWFC